MADGRNTCAAVAQIASLEGSSLSRSTHMKEDQKRKIHSEP